MTDWQDRLAVYADGELQPEERAQVEAALAADTALQRELEHLRRLRRATHRALDSQQIPTGLAERLQVLLARERTRRVPRVLKLGVSGLAMAAAVVLAVLIWPRGAAATPVTAAQFANIYRRCAVAHRHDGYCVRGMECCKAACKMGECGGFACKVPNVAACGRFKVDGACGCSPTPGLRLVHVFFRGDENDQVISAFAIDGRIRLCDDKGAACRGAKHGKRPYREAVDGDVAVVEWDEGARSYVIASRMEPGQLVHLADDVTLAATEAGRAVAAGKSPGQHP